MQTSGQRDKCFCQCQFWCKNVNFGHKKCKHERNVNFSNIVSITTESDCICKTCLFLEKHYLLFEGLYTLTKCQILIKTSNFLMKCVDFH